jgi:ABC-type antimicrobial peptide transport system, ATPase component
MSDLKEAAAETVAATVEVRELQHVLKDEGSELTLDISDLELYEGQLIYVCGANGTGKSTLFQLLALQVRPNEKGHIQILDKTFPRSSDKEEADQRGRAITYIPQGSLGLDGDKTPLDTIRDVLCDYDRLRKAQAAPRAEEALRKVKLDDDKFRKRIKNLSGGEQARVAVAKAYARKRAICLADEILSALDDPGQKLTLQIFQEMVLQEGCTIAIIVHEPGKLTPEALRKRELIKYFHRVLMMECTKMDSKKYKSKIIHDETTVPVPAEVSETPASVPSPAPPRFNRWTAPVLSIGLTTLILAVAIWLLPSQAQDPAACIVPNIVDLDEAAANIAISSLGLQIVKSVRFDSKVPKGTVLSQEPAIGTKLRPCRGEMTIEISLGPTPSPLSHQGDQPMEPDIDRPGMDYRNFDLSEARPELCRTACANETQCKAYTYAKPGVQGPNARCWLKFGVPNPVRNQCCVSGLKVASMSPLPPAPNTGLRSTNGLRLYNVAQ